MSTQPTLEQLNKCVAELSAKLDSMNVNQGMANAQLKDDLVKAMNDAIARSKTEKKAKKAVEDGAVEDVAEEKKDASKHPNFPLLTKTAWKLKKTGDDHVKLEPYTKGLYQHYKPHLLSLVGEEVEKKVLDRTDYKDELKLKEKRNSAEAASIFVKYMWKQLDEAGQLKAVTAKLMADFKKNEALGTGGAVKVVGTESASPAEAAAKA